MERMEDLEEMLRELSEKYKNSKSVEVYKEDLEGWFKIIDDLREENKNLKEKLSEITMVADDEKQSIEHILELEEENKNLRAYADNLDSENDNQAIEIEELKKENKKLRDEVDYFRQCYLDLKKLCEREGFMLSDEEVTKMFNLDEIK